MARALVATLGALLVAGAQADPALTYRWVYRNPLTPNADNANMTDQGMGSFYGSRNSVFNDGLGDPEAIVLQYNHGGSFAVLPNGSLAMVWQASPQWWEGSMDQAAYWSLSDDDGDTWGPSVKLWQNTSNGGGPIWGPQLHMYGNTIFMFFAGTAPAKCEQAQVENKSGKGFPPGGDLMLVRSTDNGETWGPPQLILSGEADGGIAKLNVARLTVNAAGDWLLPWWREASGAQDGACWGSKAYSGIPGVFRSQDKGDTWQMVTPKINKAPGAPGTKWLIENAIENYQTANGTTGMLQVFRATGGFVWQSHSSDDGATWTDAAPGPLPSPNSKTDLGELPDGSIIAAFNNISADVRRNLTLARTVDGGLTWEHLAIVEGWTDPAASSNDGAFSYPSVLYLPRRNRVLVTYTVTYPPIQKVNALQQFAEAVAPDVYQIKRLPSGKPLGQDVKPVPLAPGVEVQPGGTSVAGRKLAAARGGGPRRQLQQFPFDQGAWNKVCYGMRAAYIDLDVLLGRPRAERAPAPQPAAAPQPAPAPQPGAVPQPAAAPQPDAALQLQPPSQPLAAPQQPAEQALPPQSQQQAALQPAQLAPLQALAQPPAAPG